MSEDTDWVARYEDDPGDDSDGPSRPPIWVVVLVVAAVVTGGWLLVTQGSTDTDPATSPPLLPVTPDEASVVTTPTFSPNETDPVSVFGNPPISLTAESPEQLRGYVAVTSPDDPPFDQYTLWVFRPGGSLVSRADNVIERVNDDYPMLITAGHLILGDRILDIDLSEPPISLWADGSVIPGSGPGDVWLEQSQDGFIDNVDPEGEDAYRLWVSPVDLESLTVGEQVEVTRVFDRPVVGVADGLIVDGLGIDVFQPELSFWSPADGLVSLDISGYPAGARGDSPAVVAASGDFVVIDLPGRVDIFDIVSGEHVVAVLHDFAVPGVRSACLSPDRQHVILVAWDGEAAVANTATGEVIGLDRGMSVQPEHGIGWTTDDQLVFIGDVDGDGQYIFGFDTATGESFSIAELVGNAPWWLTASGTMC